MVDIKPVAYQVKDESIQADGGSFDIGNCANVLQADRQLILVQVL